MNLQYVLESNPHPESRADYIRGRELDFGK